MQTCKNLSRDYVSWWGGPPYNDTPCIWCIRIVIPREKRGIEELHDEEFLTRKAGEENEELTSLKSTKIL